MDTLTGATTELLQAMIRNACVNDGTPDSGGEVRNADLLQQYLEGAGLDVARFENRPGRTSIVARIEGSDPDAPSLCLMGHTDVVPVNPDGWTRDPFGGELVDGEVWGRGAIDMLNVTSSMAVAFKHLARTGFRPKGTLDLPRRRRRGGRWPVGRQAPHRQPLGCGRGRLRAHRAGRLVVGRPRRHTIGHRQHRREGHGLAPAADRRHARPRLDALRVGQCVDHRSRGGAPARARSAPGPISTICGRPSSPGLRFPMICAPHWPTRTGSTMRSRSCRSAPPACCTPARTRPSRPMSSTAGRRRTRSPTSWRSTSTSARCPARPTTPLTSICAAPSVTWPTGSRSVASRATRSRPARRSTRRCGMRWRRGPRRRFPGAELTPGIIVGGTDARYYRRARHRGLRRRAVLPVGHLRVVRQPLPRQRRAHRRRVTGPDHGIVDRGRATTC